MKYSQIDLSALANRSVLIVDDNHSLHRDYRAVLCPNPADESESKLDELESFLLGREERPAEPKRDRNFELLSTFQGEEAFELVSEKRAQGIRLPLAFVDMRMPPGWDGLETIERLSKLDPEMYFVIVTAYSDYSEEEIYASVGDQSRLEIVYKPFDPTELYELTFDLVSRWNQARSSE